MKALTKRLVRMRPGLKSKLIQAGMPDTPEEFISKTVKSTLNLAGMIGLIMLFLALKIPTLRIISIISFPAILIGIFLFLLRLPDVKILKLEKNINKEIVFVGRFLVIELESGVPLYDALANIVPSYPYIGPYFREVVIKVDMGTSMEDALNDMIYFSPSKNLQKILWQIVNAMQTGSEIHSALDAVVEQIVREQIVEVEKYGKTLNPLAMFYMMVAVIIPTLGMAMLTVLTNFISIDINMTILGIFVFIIGFVQLMFLNIIKSKRPAVDL